MDYHYCWYWNFSVQFGYYQFVYGNTVHFPLEAYLFGFVAF